MDKLKDDFYATEENVEELLKKFSVNILWALGEYKDYYKVIIDTEPTLLQQYVYCVNLEMLAR